TRSYPLAVKRGFGCRIEDVDGNEFLDFTAGIAVNSTGHSHPEVVRAIQEQAANLIHMSGTDFYYDLMPRLAERLSAVAPMPGPHRFYYGNSGAEAVECAIKLARYHTGRQHIVGFHGRTMGALSLTASKVQQRRRFAPLVPGVTHIRYPNPYREGDGSPRSAHELGLACPASLKTRSSRPPFPPRKSLPSSLSPFRAKAATLSPQTPSSRSFVPSATSTASSSSPMRSSPGPAAPVSGGPSNTPTSNPTSFSSPKASPPACPSASA